MKSITQWQHFRKNYFWTAIFLTLAFAVTCILSLIRYDERWYLSFGFLILAWVVLPIANYISWRNKA